MELVPVLVVWTGSAGCALVHGGYIVLTFLLFGAADADACPIAVDMVTAFVIELDVVVAPEVVAIIEADGLELIAVVGTVVPPTVEGLPIVDVEGASPV